MNSTEAGSNMLLITFVPGLRRENRPRPNPPGNLDLAASVRGPSDLALRIQRVLKAARGLANFNPFSYVFNNPLSAIDPTGEWVSAAR
mgnify:CR=1 FL=1